MAKECPKCYKEMQKSREPKAGNLANQNSKIHLGIPCWRCPNCGHIERISE